MPFFVQGFNPDRMEPGGGAKGHEASSHMKALLREEKSQTQWRKRAPAPEWESVCPSWPAAGGTGTQLIKWYEHMQ